jgi:TonB family protein
VRHIFIITILFFSLVIICSAQESASDCDFSSYKPLAVSHSLLKAAVRKVKPQYPPAAQFVGAEGKVLVKILVDREGNVPKVCAVKGHPLLRDAAEKAASEWKFKENFGFSKKSRLSKRWRFTQSEIWFNFKSN